MNYWILFSKHVDYNPAEEARFVIQKYRGYEMHQNTIIKTEVTRFEKSILNPL